MVSNIYYILEIGLYMYEKRVVKPIAFCWSQLLCSETQEAYSWFVSYYFSLKYETVRHNPHLLNQRKIVLVD
jgi:hypothetical protein